MNNVRPWLRCSVLPGRESDPKDVMKERIPFLVIDNIFLLCPYVEERKKGLWGLICKDTNPIHEGSTLIT